MGELGTWSNLMKWPILKLNITHNRQIKASFNLNILGTTRVPKGVIILRTCISRPNQLLEVYSHYLNRGRNLKCSLLSSRVEFVQ